LPRHDVPAACRDGVIANLLSDHRERSLSAAEGKYRSPDTEAPSMVPTAFIQDRLRDFSAWSANGELYPELLVTGAGLLVGQVLEVMSYDGAGPVGAPLVLEGAEAASEHFHSGGGSSRRLAGLLDSYGSDKTHHGYHSFYAGILDGLAGAGAGALATLEIGIGTNSSELVSTMGSGGRPGASNRAFRDYLPATARVYAADIDPDILYEEERIKTALVDQLSRPTFDSMASQLGESTFDLVVDDGLHSLPANLNVLLFGLKHVRKSGWVVIEDIAPDHFSFWTSFVDGILRKNAAYRTAYVRLAGGSAYLVQRLH